MQGYKFYKERQRADRAACRRQGRKKEVLIKTLVVGLKPTSIKRFVSSRASLLQSHVFKRGFPSAF
jgi:hypothetical protein